MHIYVRACYTPTDRYIHIQGIWCLKCPAGCQPAGTFKAFGAWNALRAASPQVLSRHLVLGMPCKLPTRRYFQGIWCLECPATPQVLSRHLVLGMPRLPTRRYFQGIWCLECPAGCQLTRRYFQGIRCLKCPAGCQLASTFKAFGAWNALRAANPQVLSRHLVLEMPCGLPTPTRRYFQGFGCLKCPAGCHPAGTFKAFGAWNALAGCQPTGTFKAFGAWNALRRPPCRYFQGIWCLKCPAGCQPRYFQGIWCLKCPAGCQPAGTFKIFGAWNALQAATPQVLSRHLVLGMPCGLRSRYFQNIWCFAGCHPADTFKAFGASNALRAANPQVLSRHFVLGMPCGLPPRRYFQGIWCLVWSAGCQPAGTFKAFGAWNALRAAFQGICAWNALRATFKAFCAWNALRPANPHKYFQGIWCFECPAGCQPAGTFKAFGVWNALRAANPQVLSRHLVLEMPCGLPNRRYFQGIWCLECPAGCQPAGTFKAFGAWNSLRAANPQVLSRHLVLEMPCGMPNRQVLSRHLVLGMPCGLPTHRYFQGIMCGIWCWKCLRAANPQVLSRHLVLGMPRGLPTRRYFQGIWCLECPAGCQPAGTFKAFGAWTALRAANPQVLSRHLALGTPCGLPTRRYFQGIWCLKCLAGCHNLQVLSRHLLLGMPCGLPPAGTFKAFGAWNALRAANPQVLSRH